MLAPENQNNQTQNDNTRTHLGRRVRTIRTQQRLTLEKLAHAANLSKSHLSRIERGEKAISVAALIRLAQVLGTSTSALLGEQISGDTLHRVNADSRQFRPADNGNYEFAPLSRADGGVNPSILLLRMSEKSEMQEDAFHPGQEVFFVLSGVLEVQLLSQSHILRAGDYMQFPSALRHRVRGLAPNTEALVVITDNDGTIESKDDDV